MTARYTTFERIKDIKELANKYRKECPINVRAVNSWLVNRIYDSPAPRYYITFEEARRNVSRILSGETLNRGSKTNSKMY